MFVHVCIIHVYKRYKRGLMRECTGKYTEVWQKEYIALACCLHWEASGSVYPTATNFISFRPQKSEWRFAVVAPAAAFVSEY